MDTTDAARRLRLAHTQDVDEAVRLADELGAGLSTANCSIYLPHAWVFSKSQGPAEIAAWAVRHCDDSATLKRIVKNEKRQSVREALLDSKHLDQASRSLLHGVRQEKESGPRKVSAKGRANQILSRKTSKKMGSYIDNLNLLRELAELGETQYVDLFFDAYAARDEVQMVQNLLLERFLPTHYYAATKHDVFMHATYDPDYALSQLSEEAQANVLFWYAQQLAISDTPPSVKMGAAWVREGGDKRDGHRQEFAPHDTWLDNGAIAAMISNPTWAPMLTLSLLSKGQLKRLLDDTFAAGLFGRAGMLNLVTGPSDYSAVPEILKRLSPGDLAYADEDDLQNFGTAVWASGDSALVHQYLAVLDAEQLLHLIVGGYSTAPGRVKVPTKALPVVVDALVAQAKKEGSMAAIRVKTLREIANGREAPIARELTLKVPGVAAGIVPGTLGFALAAGRIIYETLSDTGISLEMAMDLLYAQPDGSLVEIAESCRSLARSYELQIA
jgi:hypothetical protein